MMVSFVLSFFPRDVLDEILNLIESVSEDFPSYSYIDDRAITSLWFADGVDALAEKELELEAQAIQLTTNSANDTQMELKVKRTKARHINKLQIP